MIVLVPYCFSPLLFLHPTSSISFPSIHRYSVSETKGRFGEILKYSFKTPQSYPPPHFGIKWKFLFVFQGSTRSLDSCEVPCCSVVRNPERRKTNQISGAVCVCVCLMVNSSASSLQRCQRQGTTSEELGVIFDPSLSRKDGAKNSQLSPAHTDTLQRSL